MQGSFRATLLLILLVVAPARAEWIPDAWITLTAKVALLTSPETRGREINVDTVNGMVTLHGKVRSSAAREGAESIVGGVRGVREVQNLLQVVAPERVERVERSDAWIRRKAKARLRELSLEPATRLSVGSVNAGVILLAGKTPSQADHLEAIRAVREVPGVRAVATEVALVDGDVSSLFDGYEFGDGGRSARSVARDLWITAQVKLALLAEPRVPALDVSVDTTEGRVTLFGIVPSAEVRSLVLKTVRSVRGAPAVHDHLQVVSREQQAEVRRRDDELEGDVRRQIYSHRALERAVVRVSVRNGVARLTGTVPSDQHRLLAATAAREVEGVRAVEQDLRVRSITRPTASAS